MVAGYIVVYLFSSGVTSQQQQQLFILRFQKWLSHHALLFWPAVHNLISYFAPTNLSCKRLFLSGFLGVVRVYCMPLGSLQQEQHFPNWAILQGLEQLRPCNVATDLKMIRRKKTLAVGPAYFLKAFVLWKTWCITMR